MIDTPCPVCGSVQYDVMGDDVCLSCCECITIEGIEMSENGEGLLSIVLDGTNDIQRNILSDIVEERMRQDDKWGEDRDLIPMHWLAILTEEVGELAQEIVKQVAVVPQITDKAYLFDVTQERMDRMRNEAIQVAAVAVAFIEYLDRK